MAIVVISTIMIAYRLVKGPTLLDRVLATDAIAVNTIIFIILSGIKQKTPIFFDVAIVIAILSFVGTVAVCKYLHQGVIVNGSRN